MKSGAHIFFGIILVLVAVYVLTYSVDVRRGQGIFIMRLVGHFDEGQKLPVSASYRWGGSVAKEVYLPIEFLDRRVRRDYWTFTYHTNMFGP